MPSQAVTDAILESYLTMAAFSGPNREKLMDQSVLSVPPESVAFIGVESNEFSFTRNATESLKIIA